MDAATFSAESRHCGNNGRMVIQAHVRETEEFEDNTNPLCPR